MSPLTSWHYLLIVICVVLFLAGTVLALRSRSKFSVFLTVVLVIGFFVAMLWPLINESVYKVQISNLSDERFYQSEQILIKGTVRNVGNHPVGQVSAVLKLSNIKGGTHAKASQFSEPSAFEQLFQDDDPEFKRQNVFSRHVIAESLNPGASKTFRLLVDYPSHFDKASFEVEAQVD